MSASSSKVSLTLKDATKRYANISHSVSTNHSRHASSAHLPTPKLNVVSRGG